MDPVFSLWIGPELKEVERICIKSFQKKGHPFILYSYTPPKRLPRGVSLKDAKEILPENKIFTYSKGEISAFSNLFRYKALYDRGGIWVDLDMFCLQPFVFKEPYIFSSERLRGKKVPNVGVLKAPPKSKLFLLCYKNCLAQSQKKDLVWGSVGPKLFQTLLPKSGLSKYVVEPEVFCPLSYEEAPKLFEKGEIPKGSFGIHLWNQVWERKGWDKNASYPKETLFEKLRTLVHKKRVNRYNL